MPKFCFPYPSSTSVLGQLGHGGQINKFPRTDLALHKNHAATVCLLLYYLKSSLLDIHNEFAFAQLQIWQLHFKIDFCGTRLVPPEL